MKISVSSYSFSQAVRNGLMTEFDCIAKAKEMGFEAIEFTELPGSNTEEQKANAAKFKAEADRAGISINAYLVGAVLYRENREEAEAEVERLKTQLDIAAILGAKVFRHDVCYALGKSGNARSFGLMLPEIVRNIREVTEYGEKLGIKTCSENHGYIAQDSYRIEQMFNAVAEENYGVLVDIGNFICVDEDPAAAVSRLAPYACHVHVKDMLVRENPVGKCCNETRGCNYFCGTVVGEGDIPVKKCLKILKRAGYDGFLTIEYEGAEDCISGLARGIANLREILSQI